MRYEPTNTRIGLLLYAHDVGTLMSTYTHIEIARAQTADAKELTTITSWSAEKAAITAGSTGPYKLCGTVLELALPDGSVLTHMFSGSDPISADDAAAELNSASPLLDCTSTSGKLVIRTAGTGCDQAIMATGGDACHWLNIPFRTSGFGKSDHISLKSDTVLYNFVDGQGSTDYHYRYRFVRQSPETYSTWLRPTAIGKDLTVALDKLSVGLVKATGLHGLAAANSEVHVTNLFVPKDIDGFMIVGDQVGRLDASGKIAFPLIKGSKVEFYIVGTSLHRTITVPDVPEFDMLDPSLVTDDAWGIVVPPYTSLPRTTL